MVRLAVFPHKSRAVNEQHDMLFFYRGVMHYLVKASLKKRRIHGIDRYHAL